MLEDTSNTKTKLSSMAKAVDSVHEEHPKVPWWTSCRLALSLVGLLGTICIYMLRVNMSVAIVCMTRGKNTTIPVDGNSSYISELLNNGSQYTEHDEAHGKGEFDWNRQLRGWMLSSFHIGYIMTQIPSGWLANKYGARRVIGGGVASLTSLTLATAVAARTSVYILMAVQVLKGVASGVYYIAFVQLLGRWAPPNERSVLSAIFFSGSSLGSILSSILSGVLCDYGFDGGWPAIFYVCGIIGASWCLVWWMMGYSSPAEHPRITDAELTYIQTALSTKKESKPPLIPWRGLLTSIPLYTCLVANISFNWCFEVALSSLPQFMHDVLKLDIKQNGLYNSMPYIVNFCVSIVGSIAADYLISKSILSVTATRKLFQTFGMLPSAAMSIGVAFLPPGHTALSVVLLSLWVGLLGFVRCGYGVNRLELAPRFSGIIMVIDNLLYTITGFIVPPVVAALTENGSATEWQRVFFISSGVCVLGWIVYLLFADATEQEWAKVDSVSEDPAEAPNPTNAKECWRAYIDGGKECWEVSEIKSAGAVVLKITKL